MQQGNGSPEPCYTDLSDSECGSALYFLAFSSTLFIILLLSSLTPTSCPFLPFRANSRAESDYMGWVYLVYLVTKPEEHYEKGISRGWRQLSCMEWISDSEHLLGGESGTPWANWWLSRNQKYPLMASKKKFCRGISVQGRGGLENEII